jgi:hypothetical protein
MKTKIINKKPVEAMSYFENLYKNSKTGFLLHLTNSTAIFEAGNRRFICGNSLTFKELNFISSVKKHAKTLKKTHPNTGLSNKDISFNKFSRLREGDYLNMCEIDINKAYWNIAKQKGYIDDNIYMSAFQDGISKKTRLMAAGSLATDRVTYQYSPADKTYVKIASSMDSEENRIMRSYFFDIAKELDIIMLEAYEKFNVAFYWVDALFANQNQAKEIVDFIHSKGLGCSFDKIDKMSVVEKEKGLYYINVECEGKIKTFKKDTRSKIKIAVLSAMRVLSE